MLNRTVGDIMSTNVCRIHMNEGIDKAIHVMLNQRVSILPVVNTAGCCVGVITFQDLVKRQNQEINEQLLGNRNRPDPTRWLTVATITEVMSTDFFYLSKFRTVAECIDLLVDEAVHHIPVLDDQDHLVGMVSPHDILKAIQELKQTYQTKSENPIY